MNSFKKCLSYRFHLFKLYKEHFFKQTKISKSFKLVFNYFFEKIIVFFSWIKDLLIFKTDENENFQFKLYNNLFFT